MNTRTRRISFNLSICASLLCAFAIVSIDAEAGAEKGIKRDDARKLIAALSIFELNKEAVTVKEISPSGAVSNVLASVKLGFRFEKGEAGNWRAVEMRTGDRQWESFELLARVLGSENVSPVRAELDAFVAELVALGKTKNEAADNRENKPANAKPDGEPPKELRRGALSVKNPAAALAPLGSSVVVELEVETSVDFVRDARGRWQVALVRVVGETSGGGYNFEMLDAFERALNTEKRGRALADLETLGVALEAYRRERGSYLVAESASDLVDNLNPRYIAAFIRFDPWHRPYEYEGTRERFTLRSLGADGKANTPDDVTVGK
jgi:hypothetical protein